MANNKKQRKSEHLEPITKMLIFCEGEQTEPLYFKGFESAIKTTALYKNLVFIHVEGVGAETLRVIYAAEKYVKDNSISDTNIWCVYDKDSFPKQDFNAVNQYADTLTKRNRENNTFHVAWSNQCIEYWFILHFDWYVSDNDRKYYLDYLDKKFSKFGLGHYEKNNEELFSIMMNYGNPKKAIRWAERRIKECDGKTDSESVPATKVYLLVQELSKYLPDDMKGKFI